MKEWTAADIGRYDQALAAADTELDTLILTLQIGTSESGERQALADVGLLVSQHNPTAITGLLMAALRRLAAKETP